MRFELRSVNGIFITHCQPGASQPATANYKRVILRHRGKTFYHREDKPDYWSDLFCIEISKGEEMCVEVAGQPAALHER